MKHFLTYIDEAIKQYWNEPALTNYGANTITYGDVASGIEKYHIIFEKCGINKGDKIALCAKNSAEWCVAYLAVLTYDAVAVPLLPDFLPENVVDLTRISDSRMIIVDNAIMSGFVKNGVADKFAALDGFCAILNLNEMQFMAQSNNMPADLIDVAQKTD